MSQARPLVAAAIIVKNESEHLKRCLRALQGFCDEIIVVDTGSSDDTIDVAKSFGVTLLHKEWRNDFAASRNFALDAVTAEWVLYIDADEELIIDNIAATRQMITDAEGVMAFGLQLVAQKNWSPYYDFRLWRHCDDIRFIGEIHETTMGGIRRVADETNRVLQPTDIKIIHHGYEGDLTAKHRRNLPLILAELKTHPENINLWNHLGRVYLGLGQPEKAEQAFRSGIARVEQFGMRMVSDSHIFVSMADLLISQRRNALGLIRRAMQLDASLMTLRWMLARQLVSDGKFEQAIVELDILIEYGLRGVPDLQVPYNLAMFDDWPKALKVQCLFALMRVDETEELLSAVLGEKEPDSLQIKYLETCQVIGDYLRQSVSRVDAVTPIELDDVTFVIPVRIETADRLANVKKLVNWLGRTYNSPILIGSEEPESLRSILPSRVQVVAIDGHPDLPFHMTRVVNEIVRHATTAIRVHLDTDTLLPPDQLMQAVEILRAKEADMVLPFTFAVGVPKTEHAEFVAGVLELGRLKQPRPMLGLPTGLVQVWNADSFEKSGTENEHLIGWAPEDAERVVRLEKLKMKVRRVAGPAFHLDHETIPSRGPTSEYHAVSTAEIERVQALTTEELVEDIATWPWRRGVTHVVSEPIVADDLTILIRVRIDGPDRLRNLVTCTNTLLSVMSARIIVGIGDPALICDEVDPRVEVVKVNDPPDGPFESMRIVNELSRLVKTEFSALVDTDAVIPINQWSETLRMLRNAGADLVYPYDGRTIEVPYGCHPWLERSQYDALPPASQMLIHDNSVGAAMAWRKSAFDAAGMENENFRSWGFEDNERFARATTLEMSVQRVPGVLYHIAHRRGPDSQPSEDFTAFNKVEYERIRTMTRDELRDEINTWSWRTKDRQIKVLIWTDPWHGNERLFDPGDREISITSDRHEITSADVVIFGLATLTTMSGQIRDALPERNDDGKQKWVLVTREAASHFPLLMDESFRARFDVIASYEQSSDVWMPYVWNNILGDLPPIVPLEQRFMALASVWISSTWDASGRIQLLSDLMVHMQVESYGRKFNSRGGRVVTSHAERIAISARHRFVLAFENARDVDYVTEKFFEPLEYGAVPVYWGAPNIEDFAPGDHCYIDASKFASAKELADFLRSMTDDEYMRYHQWREQPLRQSFVDMCASVPRHFLSPVVNMVREQQ